MKTVKDLEELLKGKGYEVSTNIVSIGSCYKHMRLYVCINCKQILNSINLALFPHLWRMYNTSTNLVIYIDYNNDNPVEIYIQSLYNWIRICMPDAIKPVQYTMKPLYEDSEGNCFCKIPIEDGISESEDDRYNAYFNLVSVITHKGYSCHHELRDNIYSENGKLVKDHNALFAIVIEQSCKIKYYKSFRCFGALLPDPWKVVIGRHYNEGHTLVINLDKDENGGYYNYPSVEDSLALLEWINENLLPNPENDDDKPAKANNNQYLDSLLASVTKGSWIDDDALFEVLKYLTSNSFYAIKKLLEFYRDNRTV